MTAAGPITRLTSLDNAEDSRRRARRAAVELDSRAVRREVPRLLELVERLRGAVVAG